MRTLLKDFFVFFLGLFSLLYLLNLGVGIVEILPDNLPIVGNLDEAGATAIFIFCLKYFGINIARRENTEPKK